MWCSQDFGEPVRKRFKESQDRPQALDDLGKSLVLIKKALDLYYNNDERYNHLDKADVERVVKCFQEKQKWFEEKQHLIIKMKPYDDPVVLCSQIKSEKDFLDKTAWSVLNKPKPKVEPPKPEPAAKPQQQQNDQQQKNNNQDQQEQQEQNAGGNGQKSEGGVDSATMETE